MNSLRAFYEDLFPIVPYLGRWVLGYSAQIAATVNQLVLIASGASSNPSLRSAWRPLAVLFLYQPAQLFLTASSLLLNAVASLLNNTIVRNQERQLKEDELKYLTAIFADNLDYQKIRIQFAGVKELLKISPQAVGNDIFLRKKWGTRIYYDDLSLSEAGLRLLGHEACHVWQAQHSGVGYIGDSLITQLAVALGRWCGIRLSDGYHIEQALRSHLAYQHCNVEQQAVIAELIGVSCAADKTSALSRECFCKTSGIQLSDEDFAGVMSAHEWLQKHSAQSMVGW